MMINRPLALYPRVLAAMGGDPGREWRIRDLLAADPTLPTKAHLRRVLDWMAKDGVVAARTEYVRGAATTFVRPVPGAAMPEERPEASAKRAGVRLSAIERAPVPQGWKRCSTCRAPKPLDEFARNRKKSDGRDHRCKRCMSIYQHERWADPEIGAELRRRWRERYKQTGPRPPDERQVAARKKWRATPSGRYHLAVHHARCCVKNAKTAAARERAERRLALAEAELARYLARKEAV